MQTGNLPDYQANNFSKKSYQLYDNGQIKHNLCNYEISDRTESGNTNVCYAYEFCFSIELNECENRKKVEWNVVFQLFVL